MSLTAADGAADPRQLNPDGYWQRSERPLASLLFLLPLILIYELGTSWISAGVLRGRGHQIRAFVLLHQFFSWFGAGERYLPALAIVGILLAWHIARRDPWRVSVSTLCGMALESAALALPVLAMGSALAHHFPLAGVRAPRSEMLILMFGAGVYEELVFRLILLTYLSLIFRDAFRLKPSTATLLMVVISGVLFSVYHNLGPDEPFHLQSFTFRTLAGIYFAVLFLTRGFGITAASHAAYDVLIVMLSTSRA